ncbi:MAG: hypothetical protein ACT6S0_17070 [Roseateles sp.]|uniref:hypothetical protein n=1 Tax=Roseateles sp. TaxID=1971397 RepID=UPI0040353CA6
MSTAAQFSQTLLAVWRQRHLASPWVVAALLALAVVAGLIWLPLKAAWLLPAAILLVIVHGAWMAVCANLQEQNHPYAAHCVPGQLRALRQAALLGWALCSVLSTGLVWFMLPASGFWPFLLLINSLVAFFLLWASRTWWLWLLLALLWPVTGAFSGLFAPVWQALTALWASHTLGVLALSLLAQAWLVTRAFGNASAGHQASYARRTLMRRAMTQMQFEGMPASAAAWGGPLERLAQPFVTATSAWLRHVLAGADNARPRSVMARAEIVLHGNQHWLLLLVSLGAVALMVLIAFALVLATTDISLALMLSNGAFGIGIGIASAGFSAGFTLTNTLWHSRREQALLRLLPGMPQGRLLNQAVARLQLRDFGVAWALTTLALLALADQTGHFQLLCLPLAALPVAALYLTRRPALMRAPTPLGAVLPWLAFFLLAGLLYVPVRDLGMPLWLPGLAMPALAAALLAWRWRRLSAAPTALPAGWLSA